MDEQERFEIAVNTPAGQVKTTVEISTGFVPVTAIVPLMYRLGQQAQALEEEREIARGKHISCAQGCAACCRMLVPVSVPEAFALRDMIGGLPEDRRQAVLRKLKETQVQLERAGLLHQLRQVAETDHPITDEDMEPLNRAYYALRLPCPFLENESCSIYADRPAACRELLVTSPAALCDDLVNNPVRPVAVPIRASTVLGLLWSNLTQSPPRLIPLPLAADWAERHASENRVTWKARDLLKQATDKVWQFLSRSSKQRIAGSE